MEMISLKGLDKAEVLAALYNCASSLGLASLSRISKPMTAEMAQKILDGGVTYFDYLQGRVMKIDLSGNELDPWLFDRDNGVGAAERAISTVRKTVSK